MKKSAIRVILSALLALPAISSATLIDRGGGLIYDDILNITWLKDANYAKTSGHDADGRMTWMQANAWAANLSYGGYDNWRLPKVLAVGNDWNYSWAYNGSTDWGYNITSPNSELAFMYHINLGLTGYYSPTGDIPYDYGVFGNGAWKGGEKDIPPVENVQNDEYWSESVYARNPGTLAWNFRTYTGLQYGADQTLETYAWAVRDGDVTSTISEPPGIALILMAIAGLVAAKAEALTKWLGMQPASNLSLLD